MTLIIEQAQRFAHAAHDAIGQVRKYTGEPYWVHTDAVAATVESVGGTDSMICAAHLHDVLEDVASTRPEFGPHQIEVLFGEGVLALVQDLTDEYTKENFPKLNRAQRKARERERIGSISVEAKTIKLADLINNTESIVAHDPDFARVYLREKLEILPYLSDGNSTLLNRASVQTMVACSVLGIQIPIISG